jgi:hypothetical protein
LTAPSTASAQGRGFSTIGASLDRGGLSTVGGSLTGFSTGLGSLAKATPYGSGDLLRSNLTAGDAAIRRGDVGAYSGLTGTGLSGSTLTGGASGLTSKLSPLTLTPGAALGPAGGGGGKGFVPEFKFGGDAGGSGYTGIQTATVSLTSYLAAMGHTTALKNSEPLTTFVPPELSEYQRRMQLGEQALKTRRYIDARDSFDVALKIARRSPEANLSMVNACTATENYRTAALYLRKALELFPELPSASIDLRLFFADQDEFKSTLSKLVEKTANGQGEPDHWLLLAYYRYFSGSPAGAAEALRQAVATAQAADAGDIEAATTFWDGMVSAGTATGQLTTSAPSTAPATTSAPVATPTPRNNPAKDEPPPTR